MQPRLFPYSPERDVYRLLQIEPFATSDEVLAAVRRLARTFHPDRNESARATEEMQVVNAVRNLLIDPLARARYDHARLRFLAENAARHRRAASLAARSGVRLPAPKRRTRPIRSSIALTGRTLLAALRAILDAFAPGRGRLLTTKDGAVPRRASVVQPAPASVVMPAPKPAAAEVASPPPVSVAVSWETDAEIVLDPEPWAAAVVAVPLAPSASLPIAWEADGVILLEPVPMALPPTMALPIRPIREAIPAGPHYQEPVAARLGTVVPYRSSGTAASGSVWEVSAREVAGATSQIGVQNCAQCGLALSASASFCRRCGTSQARSA